MLPRDDGCWHSARLSRDPRVEGSAVSVQVLCSVGYGVAGRGNVSLPTANTALGELRAFTPRGWERPGRSTGPGFGTWQESFFVPGVQEAAEEVDGTLAVLLGLPGHQVGWRAQEEAGEQGGNHGGTDVVVVRVPEQLPEEGH